MDNKKKSYITESVEESVDLGAILGEELRAGDSVALIGDLGTGKTHFVHGIARGLGIEGNVPSPTFTIINTYKLDGVEGVPDSTEFFHIDLYRINKAAEFDELGLEEYIYSSNITVIEWAEKAPEYLKGMRFVVRFSHQGEKERSIEIEERR